MRIVGGLYKGRIFTPRKSFKARPTTDFAKENLFNILENRINWEETDALDLFAGTGSISYELASRGCRQVTAVEQNFRHYQFIRQVIADLGATNIHPLREDVFRFLGRQFPPFDLVFADPPFDLPAFDTVPEKVLASGIIKKGGLFILEHSQHHHYGQLPQFRELRTYGSVYFSFFSPDSGC